MPKSVVVSDTPYIVPPTNLWNAAASLAQGLEEGGAVWGNHLFFGSHNIYDSQFAPPFNNSPGQIASRPAILRYLAVLDAVDPSVRVVFALLNDTAAKFGIWALNPTLPNLDAYLVSIGPAVATVSAIVSGTQPFAGLIMQTQIDYQHNILSQYWGFPVNGVPSFGTVADIVARMDAATRAAANAGP